MTPSGEEYLEGAFKRTCREWFDTLVVVVSVIMCFRTHVYGQNVIPTGSMQTTLYGHHSRAGDEKTAWDAFPLSVLKKLWTGESHVECVAPSSGVLKALDKGDGYADLCICAPGSGQARVCSLPADACVGLRGRLVQKGDTIWKGTVACGDRVLVNCWRWNFWRPKAGETAVFSTAGLGSGPRVKCLGAAGKRDDVRQGATYIKRIKATPGETYVLEHPLPGGPTEVTMGEDEFFMCGDNYDHSSDSRYWGTVPRENLSGTATRVIWPLSRWGGVQ